MVDRTLDQPADFVGEQLGLVETTPALRRDVEGNRNQRRGRFDSLVDLRGHQRRKAARDVGPVVEFHLQKSAARRLDVEERCEEAIVSGSTLRAEVAAPASFCGSGAYGAARIREPHQR